MDASVVYSSTFARTGSSLLYRLTNCRESRGRLAANFGEETAAGWKRCGECLLNPMQWNLTSLFAVNVPHPRRMHLPLCQALPPPHPPSLHNRMTDVHIKAAVLISSCYVSALRGERRCTAGILLFMTESQIEEKDSILCANSGLLASESFESFESPAQK